jgi:trehalose 6-phosphate phosphatase
LADRQSHILAKRHASVLAHFALSNVLLAFDFDGTLAPIVAEPRRARMRARTRRLLMAVAERYPCVVISGRSRADVASLIKGVPIWHVSGNHGLEPWGEDAAYVARIREWMVSLREALGGLEGVAIEDKGYSVAIHYRNARARRPARAAIRAAVSRLRGARVFGGHEAVNLVPRGAPNKAVALERSRRLLVCDTAIYVGDDETDEDVFASARADRLLGIRIGSNAPSRAHYRLEDQREIDPFLQALLALRPLRHGVIG